METMLFPKDEYPPIIINVFDEDRLLGKESREFIGSCLLDVRAGIENKWITLDENEIPKPTFHELEYGIFFFFFQSKIKSSFLKKIKKTAEKF